MMITEIKSDEPISISGILTSVEVEKQKSYNQALEDFDAKIKECCSIVGSCDFEDMEKIKEQLKK